MCTWVEGLKLEKKHKEHQTKSYKNLSLKVGSWKQNTNNTKQGVQKVSKQKSMIKAKEFGKVPIPNTLPWKRREWGFWFLRKQNILCISSFLKTSMVRYVELTPSRWIWVHINIELRLTFNGCVSWTNMKKNLKHHIWQVCMLISRLF